MPLSKLQSDILRLLAAHRDPESYVAGSAWLTRDGSRRGHWPSSPEIGSAMLERYGKQ